jgi:hypothetical protein
MSYSFNFGYSSIPFGKGTSSVPRFVVEALTYEQLAFVVFPITCNFGLIPFCSTDSQFFGASSKFILYLHPQELVTVTSRMDQYLTIFLSCRRRTHSPDLDFKSSFIRAISSCTEAS